MRAIDCSCRHHFGAADNEELFELCRERVTRERPEMGAHRQIPERIAADAYDAVTVA